MRNGTAAMVVLALFAFAGECLAQTPGFHPVGFPADGSGSRVYGLSADGAVAAGTGFLSQSNVAFTWTLGGGRNEFGREAGLPASNSASAISGDGITVVGGTNRAFRYQGPGTYQAIAPIGGYTATAATGVSGDGSVVVGRLYVPQSFAIQAFRWTSQTGLQPLGYARPGDGYDGAAAVSRDGGTIVGTSSSASDDVAFRWQQGTGMVVLPSLPGSVTTDALGVNFDGSIIVGDSGSSKHAVMWRNGQISDLGLPVGFSGFGQASAVNDLGTVVVGSVAVGSNQSATIWTPTFGMEYLSDCLLRNGIQIPSGWTLLTATAVSADGLTIAGWGSNATTGSEGFVVTIPAPSSLLALTAGALLAARRRRA